MMMRWITLFLLSSLPLYASLGEETRNYTRSLFRVHKELKKENTTTKSIERVIIDLRKYNRHFFSINAAERSKINKRDNIIDDKVFENMVISLKAYPNQPEAKFLQDYIATRKPKLYRQLFLFRYIIYKSASFKLQAEANKVKLLTQIQKLYVEKKTSLGKRPSFQQLGLPPNLLQYKNPINGDLIDWLYVGDKTYSSTGIQVVVAIPVAAPNGRVLAIREDGSSTGSLTYAKVKAVMQSKPAQSTAKPNTGDQTTAGKEEPKVAEVDPLYLELLTLRATKVIERHNLYKKSKLFDKASSNGIKQLIFKLGEDQYKSADGSKTYTWLYLGATHTIFHSSGKRVICMTVNPIENDLHFGFCEDSNVVKISPQQYLEIVKNGVAAHSP